MRRWGAAAAAAVSTVLVAGVLAVGGSAGTASADPSADRAGSTARLTVGDRPLRRCHLGVGRPTWCGSIRVPLDYSRAHAPRPTRAPRIKVGFGWVPSTGTSHGTLVAMEGGPGYPSTGTAADYASMYGGLLRDHDLLVVDARGTGRSTPLDCTILQRLPSPSPRFQAGLTACGRQLDHTWRRPDGRWVHASDLFTTANTARDLARVLTALHLRKVDLYGDSYGTYFAQSFLSHFPGRLRSVVLDSAYEARDLDPWYRTTPQTARRAFDQACRRAVGCAKGSSWHRIGVLARELRRHPVSGEAVGTDARRHHYTVDVTALINIINDAGYDTDPYRQLDASVRAYLRHRDKTPLLRLYAQDVGYDYSDYVRTPATYYSDATYFAIACTDYPQLFDMHSSPTARRHQLAHRIANAPAGVFRPFTAREWTRLLPYTEAYRACVTWPSPTHRADPAVRPGPMNPRHVPVLVLNGSFDSLTPAAGGAHVARQIGPAAHAYVVANNVHLVALYHQGECGSQVMRRFIADPRGPLEAGCLRRIPAIRTVPQFPATLAQTSPAQTSPAQTGRAQTGRAQHSGQGHASLRDRRLARIAVSAAGDAINRFAYVDAYRELGLRGGRVRYDHAGDAHLLRVRWTRDTTATGRVTLTRTGARGTLRMTGPGGASLRVRVTWGAGRLATAHVHGVRLRAPAP